MRRWPLAAAISYAIIVGVGLFVVPAAPEVTAPGTTLVAYYTRHAQGVRLVAWLGAISLVPLALLIAHLRSRIEGIGRDVMMLGAVGLVTSTMIWLWFGAGLALHARTLQPQTARAVADVSEFFGPILTVAVILLVGPIGAAAWRRSGGLPRWLAWLTIGLVAEQLAETTTIFGRSGFAAPGGAMNATVGAGLFLVWIVAAGIAAPSAVPLQPDTPIR